jgi:putative phosphoribosyl transferase
MLTVYQERPFFRDRSEAGKRLLEELRHYEDKNTIVFAIPRGGVPVAVEVARGLNASLDIVVSRKIGIPGNPEAGYGAIAEDGSIALNEPLVRDLRLTKHEIERQAEEVRAEIARRIAVFRKVLPPSPASGKTAIIVDDGLASGFTTIAAIKSLQGRKVQKIVVAAPVASGTAYDMVQPLVDELVCLIVARIYSFAVASFYYRWHHLTDREVLDHLKDWQEKQARAAK